MNLHTRMKKDVNCILKPVCECLLFVSKDSVYNLIDRTIWSQKVNVNGVEINCDIVGVGRQHVLLMPGALGKLIAAYGVSRATRPLPPFTSPPLHH